MNKYKYKFIFLLIIPLTMAFSSYSCKIAVLKYNGGGDWYANPTSLNNLIQFWENLQNYGALNGHNQEERFAQFCQNLVEFFKIILRMKS